MRSILSILLVVIVSLAQASDVSPRDLARAFFDSSGITDRNRYYTGEMKAQFMKTPTMGETLPADVKRSVRAPVGSGVQLVVPVTLSDASRAQEFYVFVEKGQSGWAISAIRSLALTGVLYELRADLEKKAKRSPQEQWTLENLRLLFQTDEQLKQALISRISSLRQLAQHVASGNAQEVDRRTRELRCTSARRDENGRIVVTIGGVLDNTVGFMYVPPGRQMPAMSPVDVIYLEHVMDGWYLFKTT